MAKDLRSLVSLGLEPDAVTFGKAVAAGIEPLSGVALRQGAEFFEAAGRPCSDAYLRRRVCPRASQELRPQRATSVV